MIIELTIQNTELNINKNEDIQSEYYEVLIHNVMKGDKGEKGDPGRDAPVHPYLSLERLRHYLYRVTFDNLPEDNGGDSPVAGGGCSAFVQDSKLYRNYDFNYDNAASFIVRTRDFEGMAMITGLEDGQMNDKLIAQLPYRMVDGINNNGIKLSVHLLFNDWEYTGAGDKSIPMTSLPCEILSRVKSMATITTDLADVLGNLAVTEVMGGYLLQVLVTDGTTSYVVIPPTSDNQSYELVDATSYPKMSNFRYVARAEVSRADIDLQTRPTGIERFNMMPCKPEDLRFTECYEAPTRLSEFIGLRETTKESTDAQLEAIYEDARAIYLDRARDGQTWQTMHSVVYGDKMEALFIQENWNDDILAAGLSPEEVDERIVVETERAEAAEEALGERINDVEGDLAAETQRATEAESALDERITDIEDLVPEQATETNKLADKDFVNSTVGTNTANYIYKTNAQGEKLPFDSAAELEAYSGTVTNNDYAFVTGIDAAGNTYYDRYKAVVTTDTLTWAKEYRLNNSSFTAAQWQAIQSGITLALVGKLSALPTNSELMQLLAGKIGDAPSDGKQYVRKDGEWSEVDTEGTIHYDKAQTLTTSQKAQARSNVGAQETLIPGENISIGPDGKTISASGGLDSEEVGSTTPAPAFPFVEYVAQSLTAAQKLQARQNIGVLDGTLVQFPTRDDFPDAGNPTAIYLDQATGATYRWDTATLTYKNMGSNQNPVPGPDTANGVYIKYADGTISRYDTLIEGKVGVGVAIINNAQNVRIVMHPLESGSLQWQAPNGTIPGTFNDDSKHNTDLILAQRETYSVPAAVWAREGCIYADGSEGQLPSEAVMEMFLANLAEANIALGLLGGTSLSRSKSYWSSDQASSSLARIWYSSNQYWYSNNKSYSFHARSVSRF